MSVTVREISGILKLVVIMLIFIWMVLLLKQYGYFRSAQLKDRTGSYVKAVDDYTMVVYMHTPFSPFEKMAIDRLLQLAFYFDRRHELRKELYTYERLRSAVYGTRWFLTPHGRLLGDLQTKIAYLRAVMLKKEGYRKSIQAAEEEELYIMSVHLAPSPILALLALLSFGLFVAIVLIGIWRSSGKNGVHGMKMLKYIGSSTLFLIMWLVLLYYA